MTPKSTIFTFLGLFFCTTSFGQNLITLINNCQYVKGNVASTTAQITDYETGSFEYKSSVVQLFDTDNRIQSLKRLNDQQAAIESFEYFYSKNRLVKLVYSDAYNSKLFFYQYYKNRPRKIMEASSKKELLSSSTIFLDSLNRPTLLKNYDLTKKLQFSQIAEYDDASNKLLVLYKYPNTRANKTKSKVIQYQICADDLFLNSINARQLENIETKILNLTVENNIATIVKAVKIDKEGKEEIFVQEIEFDAMDNWIQSNLYRLKKRKQKKILVQAIERTIVYR